MQNTTAILIEVKTPKDRQMEGRGLEKQKANHYVSDLLLWDHVSG